MLLIYSVDSVLGAEEQLISSHVHVILPRNTLSADRLHHLQPTPANHSPFSARRSALPAEKSRDATGPSPKASTSAHPWTTILCIHHYPTTVAAPAWPS